jgi:hypothetical protein
MSSYDNWLQDNSAYVAHLARPDRDDWLCQCGDGAMGVPIEDIPVRCPTCNHPIREDDDE